MLINKFGCITEDENGDLVMKYFHFEPEGDEPYMHEAMLEAVIKRLSKTLEDIRQSRTNPTHKVVF